jgi:hypothetical protein
LNARLPSLTASPSFVLQANCRKSSVRDVLPGTRQEHLTSRGQPVPCRRSPQPACAASREQGYRKPNRLNRWGSVCNSFPMHGCMSGHLVRARPQTPSVRKEVHAIARSGPRNSGFLRVGPRAKAGQCCESLARILRSAHSQLAIKHAYDLRNSDFPAGVAGT